MEKKTYLQPICTVINLESSAIIADSTGATAPDAGWAEMPQMLDEDYYEE